MKASMALVALLALAAAPPVAAQSPIQKVVELLSNMQAKIYQEGQEAQKTYDEFAEFCEDRSQELQYEIKTAKEEAGELKAVIEKETATETAINEKIKELTDKITVDETDLKQATLLRKKEAGDFAVAKKESMKIISTLERAVGILRKELAGGASMLQLQQAGDNVVQAIGVMVEASAMSSADGMKLTALLQNQQEDSQDPEDTGAPAGSVYESKSGSIVEVCEGLQEKAEEELAEADKKEVQNIHAFELLKQSIEDSIKFAKKELEESKKDLAASQETKAEAEGDLEVTTKDLQADTESLETLKHDCMVAAEEFEAEVKSRDEELKALKEAKKIIQETTGGAAEQTYALAQVSLLQQGSSTKLAASRTALQAVRLIRDLAERERSTALAQLATRMAHAVRHGAGNSEDPFKKVKGLITEMLTKLEKEAAEDAEQKAFCDKEMGETKTKKDDKEDEIEKLQTQIEVMSAKSAKLKEEVAVLQKELAALVKAQAEMDKLRQEEKEAFLKNKAELEQGVKGVQMALKVLNEYYAKEDKDHEAAEGASTGVIGLLEVCESDFTKGLAETITVEETAQREYEEQTKENEIEKATKSQDIKYKSKEAAALDKAITEASEDLTGAQAELEAINDYWKSLQEKCVAKPETYEERTRRREEELAGLRQALDILSGEAVLLQQSHSHRALRGIQAH